MTRINLIDPAELTDQHLFAEFREIKMVATSLNRSLRARGIDGVLGMIPPRFTLNKGHVSFFFDKGSYLQKRYAKVCEEMDNREINYDKSKTFDDVGTFATDPRLCNDWVPDTFALTIIKNRIQQRIMQKRDWYRFKGTSLKEHPTLWNRPLTHGDQLNGIFVNEFMRNGITEQVLTIYRHVIKMKKPSADDVIAYLKNNGFIWISETYYANDDGIKMDVYVFKATGQLTVSFREHDADTALDLKRRYTFMKELAEYPLPLCTY